LFFKNKDVLRERLQYYRRRDVSFHVEDFDVLKQHEHEKTHSKRRPVECVEAALEYVLPIIEDNEIRAKLCHWSTGGRSLDMIAEHRERMANKSLGYNTTVEISPLHLLFDTEMLDEAPEFWPYVQMNPAVQGRKHRLELIEALRKGVIDYVATDHAPHDLNEKFKMFAIDGIEAVEKNPQKKFTNLTPEQVLKLKDYIRAHSSWGAEQVARRLAIDNIELCRAASCEDGTSGAPWLDTYSQVMAYLVNAQGFRPKDIARVASYNPGCFVNRFLEPGYGKGFGKIEKGYMGSLTVINLEKSSTVKRSELQTKCGWSPLEWRTFPGSLEAVIVNGEDKTGCFIK
jgi:dihydroorotase-like cyclic amidohydrolase